MSPGEVSFHYLGQDRLSRCRGMLITCTLYFFIVLLYTGSKLSGGVFVAWMNLRLILKITNKETKFKKNDKQLA